MAESAVWTVSSEEKWELTVGGQWALRVDHRPTADSDWNVAETYPVNVRENTGIDWMEVS